MKTFKLLLLSTALLLPLMGIIGCETESSDQASISITPNTAKVSLGASQVFTASGWQDYSWSLSLPSYGVLSTTTGDSTTYTASSTLPTSPGVQVLTVTANNSSSSSTTTIDTNSYTTLSAQALITHL